MYNLLSVDTEMTCIAIDAIDTWYQGCTLWVGAIALSVELTSTYPFDR